MDSAPSARSMALALTAFMGVLMIAMIASGYLALGRGDPSYRVILSLTAASDLSGFALRWSNWTGDWPAGHFLIQGVWIRLLEAFGVRSVPAIAQGVLLLSPIAWLLSVVVLQRTVARLRGAPWGWLAVLGFLGLAIVTELAHDAYGEIYFILLYLLSLGSLARFEQGRRMAWLVAGALPLLGASTIRTEAIVVAAGIALALFVLRGWRAAVIFFAASSPLTLARLLTSPALVAAQVASVGGLERVGNVGILALYLVLPNALFLGALGAAVGCRPGRRPVDAARAVAIYAASGAGLLLAFFFAAMVFLTSLGPQARFLGVSLVGAVVALTCTGDRSPEDAWHSIRRWIAPWVVAVCLVQVFFLGVRVGHESPRPPKGIRDAADWLLHHGPPGRVIALDHQNWWQYDLLIYGSRSPDEVLPSYLPWGDSAAPGGTPETPPRALGEFLARSHPAFVVRPAGSPYWRTYSGTWGPEWTFLDAWTGAGRARLVYQNPDVMIYALEGEPGA